MRHYYQLILIEVRRVMLVPDILIIVVIWIAEELKKFEKRNEFIVDKYKDLKYTRPEDAEMILEESESSCMCIVESVDCFIREFGVRIMLCF